MFERLRWILPCLGALAGLAGGFRAEIEAPSGDRWMYPHNATPGLRPAAPVFATWGDDSGVDTRHAQFLLDWDTTPAVASGHAPSHYRLTRVRLTLTTLREGSFVNDSTPDPFESLLYPEDPRAVADADAGRPLELFGVGFRNGFSSATFREDSPFGSPATGERNAFAAGYDVARSLVDVGNNVGKLHERFPPFPSRPFAIGVITNVASGEPVPADSRVTFDLNLADPDVRGYLQQALAQGRLWFAVTWLGESGGFAGTPRFPDFATRDNLLFDPPHLLIEGDLVGPEDLDGDGLPDDWERLVLEGTGSSAADDDDLDGLPNGAEYRLDTDPGDAGSLLAIRSVAIRSDGHGRLDLVDGGAGAPAIEISSDLQRWTLATGRLEFTEPGRGTWRSSEALGGGTHFFRAIRPAPFPSGE